MAPQSLDLRTKYCAGLRGRGGLAAAGGKTYCLTESVQGSVRDWLAEQADLTLAELAERLEKTHGLRVDLPCICRLLQAMGLPRKKGIRNTLLKLASHEAEFFLKHRN